MSNLKDLQILKSKVIENTKEISGCKNEKITELKYEIEQMKIKERERNVVITGVPFSNAASVTKIVEIIIDFLFKSRYK